MTSISGGPGIIATSGTDSCYQTGIMRWNSSMQRKEVMSESNGWIPMNEGFSHVMLDANSSVAIQWVQLKMAEERELAELCAKHPGLLDVKEKYEIMLALVREHKSSDK